MPKLIDFSNIPCKEILHCCLSEAASGEQANLLCHSEAKPHVSPKISHISAPFNRLLLK